MTQVAVIFFSGTGTTKAVAGAVHAGATQQGANCHLIEIVGSDITDGRWQNEDIANTLDQCDAIIFGSPTYMGSVAGQFKSFLDAMAPRWFTQAWNGKLGASFTASSLASGDKYNSLTDLSTFAMQMGMLWVGTGTSLADNLNPNGFYLGVGATASTAEQLTDVDLKTATHLGQRVAEFATRLQHKGAPSE